MLSEIEIYAIKKVREKRLKEGLSQADLAFEAGFSPGFIGTVEAMKKDRKYNLRQLNIFARILKCSPQDFLPVCPFPPDEREEAKFK